MAAAAAAEFALGPAPTLCGESAGEGTPIVLCHGVTASRRYVVHGSRALERAGRRLVTYDARGHGESDPAPAGEGYGYPGLVADLERVVAARVGDERFARVGDERFARVGDERFLLGGHSMGAHTAVAYALRHPERLAGLVLIGPVYAGQVEASSLTYWDGLATALESDGIDGFVAYVAAEQPAGSAWRDSVLRFTRERMLLHRHLDAVAVALREVPRSRPFKSLAELESLEVPTLVVASGDEADPGHPHAAAVAYAEALPRARLLSEGPGESPLAWQGGKLSRAMDDFYAEALSSSL